MIRAFGRLAGLLVVGLGVALAFDATTSATGPDRTAASSALDSSRTRDAETSSDRGAVADWSLIAQNAIVAVGKKFPGEAAVYMGIVHATIYDVVVAIEGGYRPFAITPTVPPNTSLKTAVATAAHRVLVGRFRDQQRNLDDVYYAYLNGISDEEAKANGIQVGEEVGVGMLLLRANDGLDSTVPYVQRRPGPGVYEPTAPLTPLGTGMPSVLPLALDNASQFRPNGPPALHSGEYAQDFKEVKDLGRFDSSERTEEQTAVAQFWTDHDIPQWNRNLLRLADAQGLTAIETARMLAMAHVAGADAMIGCFDAKYHYLSWRPIHAIRRAATDGNSHTAPDPAWQPCRRRRIIRSIRQRMPVTPRPSPKHSRASSADVTSASRSTASPPVRRATTTDSRTWSRTSTTLGCGPASTSAIRKRMDRSWGGRSPGS